MMSRDILVEFYSKPQLGGSLQVFQGTRRQVGGSFLSSLARFAIPVLKFLGKKVLGVASNVASDVIDKKMSFRDSVPRRAKESVMETLRNVQAGKGNKRKRKPQKLTLPEKRQRYSRYINTPPTPPNSIFSKE